MSGCEQLWALAHSDEVQGMLLANPRWGRADESCGGGHDDDGESNAASAVARSPGDVKDRSLCMRAAVKVV